MPATLNARLRDTRGKSAARTLRRSGEVPGVIYGHGDETRPLVLNALELEKLLHTISVENTIIELSVGGSKTSALIREVQYHPSKPLVLHVDFLQVHAGEKLHLVVPVRIGGNPVGVRDEGGVLQEVLHDLSVECLPRDIPEAIEVDVTNLGVGESIHVRDISIPNVRILNDGDLVICAVTHPTTAAVDTGTEDAAGDAEPELVRKRAGDDE